jgi:Insertion element 4 transposase N-terminal
MAVFRGGHAEVLRRLTGSLPFMRAWHKEWVVPSTGVISQPQDRLGEAPLKMLFDRLAVPLPVPGMPRAARKAPTVSH